MRKYIEKSLVKALSYQDYKIKLSVMLNKEKNKSNPDLSLLQYLQLNQARMLRNDKQFSLQKFCRETLPSQAKETYTWLVISEPWCGDAAHVLPVLNKMASNCSAVQLKIVLRDENSELMSQFLTRGKKSIPKLIVLDANHNVLFTWGPRPKEAQKLIDNDLRIHKKLSREAQIKLQKWYNEDAGKSIESELYELINVTLQKV